MGEPDAELNENANRRRGWPSRRGWRRAWLWIHLVLAHSAGLILAVVGLSGALLVFVEPLARWEDGAVLYPPATADNDPASVRLTPELIARWEQAVPARYPDVEALESVEHPDAGHVPASVPTSLLHLTGPDGEVRHTAVTYHPETGAIVGRADIEGSFWLQLIFFHFKLVAIPDALGYGIVAWATLLGFVSLASGLVLWWPGRKRLFAALRLPLRRGSWLRWHNAIGIYLLLPTIVLLFTGLMFLRANWTDPVIGLVGELREPDAVSGAESEPAAAPTTGHAPIDSLADAARRALELHPEAQLRFVGAPYASGTPYRISLMPPGADPRAEYSRVVLDPTTGTVLLDLAAEDRSAAEWLKGNALPLHDDLHLGLVGQALVFLAGLALPALYVSGWVLWLRRRRAERRRTERTDGVPDRS